MTAGDRVVVLSSERRGTITHVGSAGEIYVERDDLVDTPLAGLNPVPYDPFELEVCNV